MAPAPKRPVLQVAVVAVLAAVLVLLAVLQYKWSLEVSRAERARIEAGLNTSVNQFRQEFNRELAQLCSAFHREPGPNREDYRESYAARYREWSRGAVHPDLVANVYVVRPQTPAAPGLSRLDPALNRFEAVSWPPALDSLRPRFEEELRGRFGPPEPEMRPFGWALEERIPALVHPILAMPRELRTTRREPPAERPRILGFVILELSRPALEQHLFPELAQRYFAGPEGFVYNVAVVGGGPAARMIYRSDARLTAEALNPPDARSPLLGPGVPERHIVAGEAGLRAWGYRTARGFGGMARFRGPAILLAPGPEPWQLLVRHRGGSLQAVVAADRRRNLILSFGVLALLAVSMAMIVASSQRERRLANLQMEFVAGVSHELRTPVAVICSAADNLAEGFVGARDQVKEYGALIRNEGRRLAGMIEQILYFAAGQAGRARYELQPVSVLAVIEDAVAAVAALPEAAGFEPECLIDPGLPLVQADPAALSRCLQNLILNACKYGGESRWARVKAEKADVHGESRVRLTVEDRGPGIDPADLPHIFEPFYRGEAARAAQIHGAGLGLSLAREIASAMGGRLTASSEPGQGSVFTLDLPASVAAPEAISRTA